MRGHRRSVHVVRIVISGSSGLIGTALVGRLRGQGHEFVRLVRGTSGGGDVPWDPARGVLPAEVIDGADAVINLSGAGIADHRWTDEYKRVLLDSRLQTTDLLARTIAAVDRKPSVFLSGSAIGWYGSRGDEQLDEGAAPGEGFLADLCRQWEGATAAAADAGVRTVHLRTGIVLSAEGGALKKQLPLFKFGLGGKFAKGHQWQSWITIDDEVGAIVHLMTADVAGPVNLTAPDAVTNAEFTATLARALHRPAILPIPSFGPKLLLGGELAESLLFTGQRVVPAKLLESGYVFVLPTLEPALRSILSRPGQ